MTPRPNITVYDPLRKRKPRIRSNNFVFVGFEIVRSHELNAQPVPCRYRVNTRGVNENAPAM